MRLGFIKSILQKVESVVTGRGRVDEDLLEELESALLQADVNVHTTTAAIEELRQAIREDRIVDPSEVAARLKHSLRAVFERANLTVTPLVEAESPPTVILMVGVNGTGKTTTIAKLAARLVSEGKSVLFAAGDTFRAAAIDQLQVWAQRVGSEVVRHREGSDPSAVIFDAIRAARSRKIDYVIADTAGRLHTKDHLMEELKKVARVVERELGRPADETLLVLDATTGQNGISQARVFRDAVHVTGIVLSKLDGTARGGIVVTIADELGLPIKFVGIGEKAEDLECFDPAAFVDALLA